MTASEPDTRFDDTSGGHAGDAPPLDNAEQVVDELLGDAMDWQRLVRTYPVPALLLAAGGGLWLGLRHGPAVVTAITGFLAREAARRVNEFLGEDALGEQGR